ncbi:MAG: response regulator transcription factor [Rhizobium sp.]|nr:MAG: response regulator transcription factor [Rhizobium sp.]
MQTNTTILLVDDHPLYHAGLTSVLKNLKPAFTLLGAADAQAGLAMMQQHPRIDLVLIDIVLPGMDGFEAVSVYGAAFPFIPRVLISGREDMATATRASNCGASGFISKSWSVERMVQLIERVLWGGSGFEPVNPKSAQLSQNSGNGEGRQHLTLRQIEVLSLLAEGKSNKEIARDLDIADRTVRAHLTELFQVLGVRSRTQALLHAQNLGLVH